MEFICGQAAANHARFYQGCAAVGPAVSKRWLSWRRLPRGRTPGTPSLRNDSSRSRIWRRYAERKTARISRRTGFRPSARASQAVEQRGRSTRKRYLKRLGVRRTHPGWRRERPQNGSRVDESAGERHIRDSGIVCATVGSKSWPVRTRSTPDIGRGRVLRSTKPPAKWMEPRSAGRRPAASGTSVS